MEEHILYQYVRGVASERDRCAVEAWAAEDPARREMLAEMQYVWELAEDTIAPCDVDGAWKRFQTRRLIETQAPYRMGRTARRARRSASTLNAYAGRIAAVLLLAVAGLLLGDHLGLLKGNVPAEPALEARVYRTPQGQRAVITLTDGTVVRLNVGSALAVPADFGTGARVVQLEGEAFFEVSRDGHRPFVVRTGQADVQVLGTVFNVHAYLEQPMHVAVAKGLVAVQLRAHAQDDTLRLSARDLAFIANRKLQSVRRQVDLGRYLAWTEGRLVFNQAPFEEVMTLLARWYDLDIDTEVPAYTVSTFNGAFQDEPLSEILNTVAATLGLQYHRERRHITFYRTSDARAEAAPVL